MLEGEGGAATDPGSEDGSCHLHPEVLPWLGGEIHYLALQHSAGVIQSHVRRWLRVALLIRSVVTGRGLCASLLSLLILGFVPSLEIPVDTQGLDSVAKAPGSHPFASERLLCLV